VVRATASVHINATGERVFELYANPANWPRVFPKIQAVRVVREVGDEKVVEVDHVDEGKVINVMRVVSATRIDLGETRRRYDAMFTNTIEAEPGGTRFTVSAEVRLKGFFRLAELFVKPVARLQIRRFVLMPMKNVAENVPPADQPLGAP